MTDKGELCEKIKSIHPEIGECDNHELKTHLEPEDADGCMEGKPCVSLGLQIAQLKANIEA